MPANRNPRSARPALVEIPGDAAASPASPASPASGRGRRSPPADAAAGIPPRPAPRLPVPDFGDPNRRPTCLETDFPIAAINALAALEGNAGKPVYQMSKWFARRRSCVFRAMLLAAAMEAPENPADAARLVWENYHRSHQEAGSFRHLRVLDCFMGGGTTLVEGARLGMRMAGSDLNPVAWFVARNEVAGGDPEAVRELFDAVEAEVAPQIRPFLATSCPRGHTGRWLDAETGAVVRPERDPVDLPPEERAGLRWEGPEIIYAFWAKHAPCQARGCRTRTPLLRSPVLAEKTLSADYLDVTCPACREPFHADLGETRMAPGTERLAAADEPAFAELSWEFAALLRDVGAGSAAVRAARLERLRALIPDEPGLRCPRCGAFAGTALLALLEGDPKRKDLGIRRKKVSMRLLIHPDWLKAAPAADAGGEPLGGWAGAPADADRAWLEERLRPLRLVEFRGAELPERLAPADGAVLKTGWSAIPRQGHFTCSACGRMAGTYESLLADGHGAPVAPLMLQCHCPQCEAEGRGYGGRFFKAPDAADMGRILAAGREWERRREDDLKGFWPGEACRTSYMIRANRVNEGWGYTHWWKMFTPRQLLLHAQLLRAIDAIDAPREARMQALGAFQQHLQNQNMFCFWDMGRDSLAPMFANANYHPKMITVENGAFHRLGRGNWASAVSQCLKGLEWTRHPWELKVAEGDAARRSDKVFPGDPVPAGTRLRCGSSTDLSALEDAGPFDLVITDPPFGDNIFYADLADFFHPWLRLVLRRRLQGTPEAEAFAPERTPHALEAVDNGFEHPDDRMDWERPRRIPARLLAEIRRRAGRDDLEAGERNPLFRREPSGEFYLRTLSACWAEAGRLLRDGGLMAFTFHHRDDSAWIDVLEALFEAGFTLVATHPIRSDESKGEKGTFGSHSIEYDIIHVCRKRLAEPEPASWAGMRRWVRAEAVRLRALLEGVHGRGLPAADLLVILRGKSLEFYSSHYGRVLTGENSVLDVRDALLGINQLLDDIMGDGTGGDRPPDAAEPVSRLFLRLFRDREEMSRDGLHKALRGHIVTPQELEERGWIAAEGRKVRAVPAEERLRWFLAPGRNRSAVRTDLDQAHFLMGAAMPGSGAVVERELENPRLAVKPGADAILEWLSRTAPRADHREAAAAALEIVRSWRARRDSAPARRTLFDTLEEDGGHA